MKVGSVEELKKQLEGQKVDLIVCNILAPVIKGLAPFFSDIASNNAQALFSGLLLDQMQELLNLDHLYDLL